MAIVNITIARNVGGIHLKDWIYKMRSGQQCNCLEPSDSNLCILQKRDKDSAEIEFYYDEEEKVCLHLMENLIKSKQVMNQLPISVKRLLNQFKDVIA